MPTIKSRPGREKFLTRLKWWWWRRLNPMFGMQLYANGKLIACSGSITGNTATFSSDLPKPLSWTQWIIREDKYQPGDWQHEDQDSP